MLTAVAAGIALGAWQLGRAADKEALIATFAARAQRPAVELAAIDAADPAARFTRVVARGRWLAERQLLLDNQVLGGVPGWHVYTPLEVTGLGTVLVNRGWVAQGPDRTRLPALPLPAGEVEVHGRLAQPANPPLRLGRLELGGVWPQALPWIDFDALAGALGRPLLSTVVLLDAEVDDGFRREWTLDAGRLAPERHRGYALQWFALAFVAGVYGIRLLRRKT